MQLAIEDAQQFFHLHHSLMFFLNQRLKVIDEAPASPEEYALLPAQLRTEVHKAFVEHPELIDAFAAENPFDLDESGLEIVRSWKHFVAGRFYILRYLKNYAVFLSSTEPADAYGVLALAKPFSLMVGQHPPLMIETRLLPFKGQIVYDGIIQAYNISFGGGVRRVLDNDYKEAKARRGIITTLPPGAAPMARAATKRGGAKPKEEAARDMPARETKNAAESKSRVPEPLRPTRDRIVNLIDDFCRQHLSEEFAVLCRNMADVLARKRPSPLVRGNPESWACGIVHAVGFANFISDSSQPHHMSPADINAGFGVSESTGSTKSLAIRKLLRVDRFSPRWTLPSKMDQNPMIWLFEVDGMLVDIRSLPVEVQEECFRAGLIPYVPGRGERD